MHNIKNLLFMILCIFVIYCKYNNSIDKSLYSIKNIELYKEYLNKYANKEILIFSEGDFSGDNISDLIIIYRESSNSNKLIGIYKNEKGKILITTPIPAPIENQIIKFYNIDERAPQEFLVSGQNGINIGFAIYRLENGEFISLFESGMQGCC